MSANGWLQILLYSLVILAVTKPLGIYMFHVFEGDQQPLPRFLGPIERARCIGSAGSIPRSSRDGQSIHSRSSCLAPLRWW